MLILQIIYCLLISLIQQTHFLVKIHLQFFLHFLEGFEIGFTTGSFGHAYLWDVWLKIKMDGSIAIQQNLLYTINKNIDTRSNMVKILDPWPLSE